MKLNVLVLINNYYTNDLPTECGSSFWHGEFKSSD